MVWGPYVCWSVARRRAGERDVDVGATGEADDVRRFDALAQAAKADVGARARLLEELAPRLRRWTRRYQGRGVGTDDLMQDAVVGALRAVAGFDAKRGPFLMWARLWVRQALQQTVAESARAFRLPTHVLWDMHELKEARERLAGRLGRQPKLIELGDELGWSVGSTPIPTTPLVRRFYRDVVKTQYQHPESLVSTRTKGGATTG